MKLSGRFAALCYFAVVLCMSAPVFSQTGDPDLAQEVVYCAFHESSGPWVHTDRFGGTQIRFNFFDEKPNPKPGPDDYKDGNEYIFAAFWNRDRTAGEFLQFIWFRAEPGTHLRIVNNANIVSLHGRLDLEDALWGGWTYEHLKARLLKLKVAPAAPVSPDRSVDARVLCDSYVRPINGRSP